MKQEIPGDATGVPVKLTAVDPNGNYHDLGTATSDMSGLYSALWTPPVEGKYTVIATFEGSNSYGSSYAETAFGVVSASAQANPMQTPVSSPNGGVQPPASAAPVVT